MVLMWLIPFVCAGFVCSMLLLGARRNASRRALDGELHDIVRATRLGELQRQVETAPVAVHEVRAPSRFFDFSNRLVLDLGRQHLELWCFWPARLPIDTLQRVWFSHQLGWVVDTLGSRGPSRLYAWRLDVVTTAPAAASRG